MIITSPALAYSQDITACFSDRIGARGLSPSVYRTIKDRAFAALGAIRAQTAAGKFPIFNHLESDADIADIARIGTHIREQFDELVVLGTGGSTLNPQSLVALAQPHDGIDKRVYFIDSMDPHTIQAFLDQLDLQDTAFLMTSKSGSTVETLAQSLMFISALEESGVVDVGRQCFIISDPDKNPLRTIGQRIGATILDHEKSIGGRFSTFTNVGLLPAAVSGVDIRALRKGARNALEAFLNDEESPAAIGAALQVAFMEQGMHATVMMPYADRLSAFATWYRQIWAESLGKQGKGTTPIRALGALDQHSQLQLYLDGPKDKFFTMITLDVAGTGPSIPKTAEVPYLRGKTMGDINAALQQGTLQTLVNNGCPVRHLSLAALNETTLSALMVHFMLETIIAAQLLGINAFDQPAVEDGKILARKFLGGEN